MTKFERVRYDMFIRAAQFIGDHIGEFAPAGIVAVQAGVLQGVIDRLQELMGEQSAAISKARYGFNNKNIIREKLRDALSEISETARSMVYEFPAIDLKFRMLRNRNDAELLAKARAFHSEAAPLEDSFIAYEMEAGFADELQTLIEEFEAALGVPGTAVGSHVEATADTGAEIRRGMIVVRTLKGAVVNKFRNDPGKLAAWLSASHIEKLPRGESPENGAGGGAPL